jgi:hypothetical protein
MACRKIVWATAVDPLQQPERARSPVYSHARLPIQRLQAAVKVRCRGHVSQRHPSASLRAAIGCSAVYHVDVVHRHLAWLELNVHGLGLVKRAVGQPLLQRQVLSIFVRVVVESLVAVRARNHPQAAVGAGARLQRHPDRARCQWTDWPVVPVLHRDRGIYTHTVSVLVV